MPGGDAWSGPNRVYAMLEEAQEIWRMTEICWAVLWGVPLDRSHGVLLIYPPLFTRDFQRSARLLWPSSGGRLQNRRKPQPELVIRLASAGRNTRAGDRPSQLAAPARPQRRSTYFEAVALYERGARGAPATRLPVRPPAMLESVLRQYPEETELHERRSPLPQYLPAAGDAARVPRSADDRRAPVRGDARHQRRAVRPGDRASAPGARRGS